MSNLEAATETRRGRGRERELALGEVVPRMAHYILSTSDFDRKDRLWPAHFELFSTNPLSIAFGACGTALFLQKALGEISMEVRQWLLDRPVTVEQYPPGLLMGTAGVAYSLFELGLRERALDIMYDTYRSPLLFEEEGLFLGVAGWGTVSLYLYAMTSIDEFLDRAVQAGEHLLEKAQDHEEGCFWRSSTKGNVYYGYGHGGSGIALFLYRLYRMTGNRIFRAYAIRGLEYDLAHGVEMRSGLTWHQHEHGEITYPYWEYGSSGVGTVLIRFYHYTKERRYRTLAERIADESANVKFAVLPSLMKGMSGIGEFMLDMYHFTGEEKYLHRARDLAASVLLYRIEKSEGIAFPGRWLSRISTDLATGSAGVGTYLHRVLERSEDRLLVDFEGVEAQSEERPSARDSVPTVAA